MGGIANSFSIRQSELNVVLARLYPTVEQTKQIMKNVELNSKINFDLSPSDYWFYILVRAYVSKKVQALIDRAIQDHKDCADELVKAYQVYQKSIEMPSDHVTGNKLGSFDDSISIGGSSSGSKGWVSGGKVVVGEIIGSQSTNLGDLVGGNKIGSESVGKIGGGAIAIGNRFPREMDNSLDEEE